MTIVETYRRNINYDFANDKRLTKILNVDYSLSGKTKKYEVICAFDGFVTIWLCTLPEIFKQWYAFHNPGDQQGYKPKIHMDIRETPNFPSFENASVSTKLSPHFLTLLYNYL